MTDESASAASLDSSENGGRATDESASEASLDSSEQKDSASAASSEPVLEPFVRLVRGDPTPEEIAALVAVLAALGGTETTPERRTPEWQAHHRKVRRTLPHGPGGWRSSGLPR